MNSKIKIEYVTEDKIKPYLTNAKLHPQSQIDLIKNSMKEFGVVNPMGIDKEGNLVFGHGRFESMKQLGHTEFPVYYIDYLSKDQIKMLRLADNQTAISEWDTELLDMELGELNNLFELEDFGFEFDEPNDLNEEEADTVPELVEDPCIKLGDLIDLGNHRLLCGDSTSEADVATLIGDNKIELIYTDPPYGIQESGQRVGRGNLGDKNSKILANGVNYKDFKDDTTEYAEKALIIVEKFNIPRQIWWGANYYSHAIPQTNNWIIWDKRTEDKYTNTNGDAEMAYVKSKWSSIRIFRHLWMGLVKGSEHGQARVHPTQKPVALAEWCFDYYKQKFNNVMDLFGGSGSTLIACENQSKSCFMMEFEPHYAQVIIQRWCDYTSIDTIKINGEEVSWSEYKERA